MVVKKKKNGGQNGMSIPVRTNPGQMAELRRTEPSPTPSWQTQIY